MNNIKPTLQHTNQSSHLIPSYLSFRGFAFLCFSQRAWKVKNLCFLFMFKRKKFDNSTVNSSSKWNSLCSSSLSFEMRFNVRWESKFLRCSADEINRRRRSKLSRFHIDFHEKHFFHFPTSKTTPEISSGQRRWMGPISIKSWRKNVSKSLKGDHNSHSNLYHLAIVFRLTHFPMFN